MTKKARKQLKKAKNNINRKEKENSEQKGKYDKNINKIEKAEE